MTRFNDTTYSNTQNNSIRKHNKHTLNNVCVWDRDSHAYTKKYIKYLRYKPAKINKSWEQNTQKYPESPHYPHFSSQHFLFFGLQNTQIFLFRLLQKNVIGNKRPKKCHFIFFLPKITGLLDLIASFNIVITSISRVLQQRIAVYETENKLLFSSRS